MELLLTMSESDFSGLTFDWDDLTIADDKVQKALHELITLFGNDRVWYRVSSSGNGLHIMIADIILDEVSGASILQPIEMDSEKQIEYRKSFELECRGRLISDSVRKTQGFRTSRIFRTKNGKKVSKWRRFK